jgi:hypothetical protein
MAVRVDDASNEAEAVSAPIIVAKVLQVENILDISVVELTGRSCVVTECVTKHLLFNLFSKIV